jgi:GeoRSP system SPASM domain protein
MGLDLLDLPVRLTWDLHGPGQPLHDADMLVIAGRIAAGGVFFVTLEQQPLAHAAIIEIFGVLQTGGCQVRAVCSGTEQELAALEKLPGALSGVQLDAAAFLSEGVLDETRLCDTFIRLRRTGAEPSLSVIPTKSNLPVIPKLFKLCMLLGAQCFKLPNARIGDTFPSIAPAELPCWPDLDDFRAIWARHAPELSGQLHLEIHDRFLWEIMTPGIDQARSEYGGCQAADSLGHVDAAGTVYACAAWPLVLGSLHSLDLETIWQSPQRFVVRERIDRTPAGCLGCRDYPLCLGGCRGLNTLLGQAGAGRDLMCREPRQ